MRWRALLHPDHRQDLTGAKTVYAHNLDSPSPGSVQFLYPHGAELFSPRGQKRAKLSTYVVQRDASLQRVDPAAVQPTAGPAPSARRHLAGGSSCKDSEEHCYRRDGGTWNLVSLRGFWTPGGAT